MGGNGGTDTADHPGVPTPRRWLVATSLALTAVMVVQRFGEVIYLFRLDRVADPLRLAARSFELWNPWWDMGSVQVQTVGYLLPVDAFFAAGSLTSVPLWIAERVFVAGLFVVAFWGCVRVADALGIGTPATRIVAGLAYVLSGVILTRAAQQSIWSLGAVLIPWVLLPLIAGARAGSPRRAAARSGVAIALMGGANAAVVLSVLPLPALWLLTRQRGPRRAALVRWWALAVVAATAWWVVGLYFFGRYGPVILDFTETVAATTAPTGVFDVLRGSADWLARVTDPDPVLPAGYTMVTRALPIAATSVIAAAGLAGLAARRLPERRFLVAVLVLGAMAVGGGYLGTFGNPLADTYRSLLDGPLGAFRNIYKFAALVTLPLVLGVAHVLAIAAEALPTWLARVTREAGALRRWTRPVAVTALGVVVVAVLVGSAMPVWNGTLTRGPGFDDVPEAWAEAREWLAERGDTRVLILPGIGEAEFDWGYTRQTPLQWGADLAWASRHQAPLGGPANIEYLDAVERAVSRGGDANLPDYLRRAGFSTVVVMSRYPADTGAPTPEAIDAALRTSGLTPSAGFGETAVGDPLFAPKGVRELQAYDVPGASVATAYDLAAATWLSGDVESVLNLGEDVFGDRAWMVVGDPNPAGVTPTSWVLTDGNEDYLLSFGAIRDNRTYVLGAGADATALLAGNTALRPRLTQRPGTGRTVQVVDGVTSVRASSAGPGVFLSDRPAFDPVNVIDGDPDTLWAPRRRSIGTSADWGTGDHWVEVRFDAPRSVDPLTITLFPGFFREPVPVEVVTTTDTGSANTTLRSDEEPQPLAVPPGETTTLRVTITAESFLAGVDSVGIRELSLPGPPTTARLALPDDLVAQFSEPTATTPAWVLTRSANDGREATGTFGRIIPVPRAATVGLVATGSTGDPTTLLDLLNTTPALSVSAASTLFDAPALAARNLIDGDPSTVWLDGRPTAGLGGDESATITLRWDGARRIDGLRLGLADGLAAPARVTVSSGAVSQTVVPDPDGVVRFDPLVGTELAVSLAYDPADGDAVGLTALEVPALADLTPGPTDPATVVEVGCDEGPVVRIGAESVALRATASLDDLVTGRAVALTPCDTGRVDLPAGEVTVDVASGKGLLAVDRLVLGEPPLVGGTVPTPRSVAVESWGPSERTVRMAGGSANLLVVNEVANPGWEARLDGSELAATVVDGWRQAWVVPAGSGGSIELVFAPNAPFQVLTVIGLLLLAALVVVAVLPDRRTDTPAALGTGRWGRGVGPALAVVGAVWCAGVAAVLAAPVWWATRRYRWLAAPLAFAAFGAAGVVVVLTKGSSGSWWWGADGVVALGASAVALIAVAGTLVSDPDEASSADSTVTSAAGAGEASAAGPEGAS